MNTGNQIVKTFKVDFLLDLWQEQSGQFQKESLFVKNLFLPTIDLHF
jgi:hypothetical protein